MRITPIDGEHAYNKAMKRIDELMDMNSGDGPAADTSKAHELRVLSILAERYEEEAFPMDLPSLAAAIKFALERQGLVRADLGRILNSRSRASELLNGNLRGLSRRMMQALHDQLKIPAEILIQDIY